VGVSVTFVRFDDGFAFRFECDGATCDRPPVVSLETPAGWGPWRSTGVLRHMCSTCWWERLVESLEGAA
jgi:hypothetical protein